MNKTCLIHQQQGIGDLIFIQKIVAKYAENDFNVICPIKIEHRVIKDHFSTDRVQYPLISEQSTLLEGFDFAREHIRLVSECEANFEDSRFAAPYDAGDFVFLALGPAYRRLQDGLMLSKYRLAGMDYSDWPAYSNYTLVNEFSSNGRLEIKVPGETV